jgi:photosystem II stability/assembly factor-like uncharacterized protein
MMAHVHARALIFASALLAIACDNEDDKDTSSSGDDDGGSTGDDGAPSTMTMPGDEGSGEEGEMLRVGWDGAAARYPLDVAHDFYGIACRGEDEAWVVGAAGTLLRTANAGASWAAIDVPTTADLTAVAAADAGPIWAVGDGVAFASSANGDAFATVDVPARAFTGVAVAPHGAYALLTDRDRSIWRVAAGEGAQAVFTGEERLHGVAVGAHGGVAVAVGELGTVLRSDDGGETFVPVAVPTSADLHAVQVAEDGRLLIAVGSGGAVVRVHDETGTHVQTLLDPALALHAVHLAGGQGHVLGDAGVMLETFDAGETWAPVALPTEATLHGLDHPGVPHD